MNDGIKSENVWLGENRVNVLIVADKDDVLADLQRLLKPIYNVFSTNSALDAYALLRGKQSLNIDVVIADFDMMSDFNGLNLVLELQKKQPGIGRILICHEGHSRLQEFLNTRMIHGHLSKPISEEEVLKCIERVCTELGRFKSK